MEELFGLSMNILMYVLLAIFTVILLVIAAMAIRNPILLKLGLRNIPRRRAQTILIIVGSMLSAVLVTTAFGTGDTISFSIRDETIKALQDIDEVISSSAESEVFATNSPAYMPMTEFLELKDSLVGYEEIDGLVPYIGETVAVRNLRNSLGKGKTRITAIDSGELGGFQGFTFSSGMQYITELSPDGVLINAIAADDLEARVGDEIKLIFGGNDQDFFVEGIIGDGGLAGIEPTVLMPLDRGQKLFNKPEKINFIAVSNNGDARGGALISDEVTKKLRVLLSNAEVARDLHILLKEDYLIVGLQEREEELTGRMRSEIALLGEHLGKEETSGELIRLFSDSGVSTEILRVLKRADMYETLEQADTLFKDLSQFTVLDIKRSLLEIAELAASAVTTFFITIALFSIMAGVLLIFLIFVMLAGARRTEMGMARAVGAKRGHLVQMFVFEGFAYDIVASAIGTMIGIGLGFGLIYAFNHILSDIAEGFGFSYHIELRSIVVSFCLGMVIVFITAAVSAYRVSRMNIAEAVRGLPETIILQKEKPIGKRLIRIPHSILRPIILLIFAVSSLVRRKYAQFLFKLSGGLLSFVSIPIALLLAIFAFILPYLRRGWLTFALGLLMIYLGVNVYEKAWLFSGGLTLFVVGLGLMIRVLVFYKLRILEGFGILTGLVGITLLIHGVIKGHPVPIAAGITLVVVGLAMSVPLMLNSTIDRQTMVDRFTYTFIGVIVLAAWSLPFDTFESITGELDADAEMFFLSGIVMVAAAVWTVMYNADLLLKGFSRLTNRFGRMRPVLVTSVAYPMNSKFRTGLTLAMFSLVVFTLIIMSLVSDAFTNVYSDTERVTGNWDIEANLSYASPIQDMRSAIAEKDVPSVNQFEAIGGFVKAPIEVRQVKDTRERWRSYPLMLTDDEFLSTTGYDFQIFADGYNNKTEVWTALKMDPSLAVVDSSVVDGGSDGGPRNRDNDGDIEGDGRLRIKDISIDSESFSPVEIEIMEPVSQTVFSFKIIGILDSATDVMGVVASNKGVEDALGSEIPMTRYRFRVAEDADLEKIGKQLESSFLGNGMEIDLLEDSLLATVSFISSFYNLLTGYMGLGLVVGIAAMGVISMRAVVERRQQIGVLRAIGYRKSMVKLTFVMESSFVALLGVFIGVALGSIVSFNLVEGLGEEIEGVRFTVPWLKIGLIVGLVYVSTILTTLLPAGQAANTLPAEALRYE